MTLTLFRCKFATVKIYSKQIMRLLHNFFWVISSLITIKTITITVVIIIWWEIITNNDFQCLELRAKATETPKASKELETHVVICRICFRLAKIDKLVYQSLSSCTETSLSLRRTEVLVRNHAVNIFDCTIKFIVAPTVWFWAIVEELYLYLYFYIFIFLFVFV